MQFLRIAQGSTRCESISKMLRSLIRKILTTHNSPLTQMIQQWLTVLGIALDFAGFAMLLREWWLAFFNEGRQMQLAEQLDRARAVRDMHNRSVGGHNPFDQLDRMQDESALRTARAEHRNAMAARRGAFLLATTLIVVGFALQIAGAWPL